MCVSSGLSCIFIRFCEAWSCEVRRSRSVLQPCASGTATALWAPGSRAGSSPTRITSWSWPTRGAAPARPTNSSTTRPSSPSSAGRGAALSSSSLWLWQFVTLRVVTCNFIYKTVKAGSNPHVVLKGQYPQIQISSLIPINLGSNIRWCRICSLVYY